MQKARVLAGVQKCWAWMTPGFWTISLEFEAEVSLTGAVLSGAGPERVRGHVEHRGMAAGGGAWANTIRDGLDNLASEVGKTLRDARP